MKKITSLLLIGVLFLGTTNMVFAEYGKQTKTSQCQAINGLPDLACTPGAVLTTDVKTICTPGYTKKVRSVLLKTKREVFAEYGIPYLNRGNYEVDHLISLELGGSNDISNLWPEFSKGDNGALIKDKLENFLHSQICKGKLSITDAQNEISNDWVKYWTTSGKSSPSTNTNSSTSNTSTKLTPVIKQNPSQTTPPTPPAPAPIFTPAPTPVDFSIPAGATGKCNDGTYTTAKNHRGACSHHGGVAYWL